MANRPTTPFPTHHASLSDGVTTVNFIFSDSQGRVNPMAARRYALQRTAIKTSQGAGKYSDLEMPYLSIAQDNWQGGRGAETFEDDTTRMNDSNRMASEYEGVLYPAGMEFYATGYRSDVNLGWPDGAGSWRYVYGESGPNKYMAAEFTASANYNADGVELYIAKHDLTLTNSLVVELRDGSKSGAVLKTVTLTAASITDTTARLHRFDWTSTQALTSGNVYAIVVYSAYSGGALQSDWQVLCSPRSGGHKSADDSTWDADASPPVFRVFGADTSTWFRFFEYKRLLYAISEPVTGNSFLFKNGDRGAADSYGAVPTTLVDATKSWTTNEWVGCTVLITKGPGSEEEQPWRIISANDATTLTVPAWNVAHTTSTEYVILGSNKFTSALDLSGYVTDVAVADEFVYFARGDSAALNVLRYQEYNAAGTWTARNAADVEKAVHLTVIPSTAANGTYFLWGTQNNHSTVGKRVWKGQVPRYWGDLFRSFATIVTAGQPWSGQVITNVTQVNSGYSARIDVAAGFGTGVVASEDVTAVNVTQGNYFGFEFMSTVGATAGQIQLQYSEDADLAGTAVQSINFPAVTANEWTWVYLNYSMHSNGAGTPAYVEDAVESLGINLTADLGAQTMHIVDGVQVCSNVLDAVKLPSNAKIVGIIPYAGNAAEPIVNPWVITEDTIYEIQTQNTNSVVELPLGELKELKSEINSQARAVNDVYIWFNLGSHLERYYSRNLDDVGPDHDAGLPNDRDGPPKALLSYPGRVYASINGGSAGYSSLLMYKGGWHEVYRSPRTGVQLYSIANQVIPSDTGRSRLWVGQGPDIIWIEQSLNPRQNSSYRYAPEGHIITPWIYADMQDINKYFKSIQIFLTDGTYSSTAVRLSYQKDNETSWTHKGNFDPASLSNDELGLGVNCKRIRFRFVIQTTLTATPYLKAWLLKGIGIVPIKHGYTWTTKLTESHLNADLYDGMNTAHGSLTTVDTVLAKLDTWASAATPLTLYSVYSALDDKVVILEDPGMQPITYSPEPTEGPIEEYVVQVSCIDV